MDRRRSENSQHSQETVFLESQGIVTRTGLGCLGCFPAHFFLAATGQRMQAAPFASSHISPCPSTLPRVWDRELVAWASVGDEDVSTPWELYWKSSVFPTCVSPLLLMQSTSGLTLVVTTGVDVFPTPCSSPWHRLSDLRYNSILTLSA